MKKINIIALASCWMYLIGNIIYDMLESRQEYLRCEDATVDYSSFYFLPQSIMIAVLVYVCRHQATGMDKKVRSNWNFFWYLSLSQVVKNGLFYPIHFAVNDYFYLITCLAITFIRHEKLD